VRTMVQQFSRQMPCPQGSVPEEWMGRLSVVTVKFAIGRDGFPSRFESMPHGLADRIAPEIWRAVQSCHWIAGTDVQGHPTAIWSSCPSGSPSSDQLHPSRTINSCRSNGSPASPPRSAHTTRVGRANINARWIEHEWGDDWHLRDTRHESGRRGASPAREAPRVAPGYRRRRAAGARCFHRAGEATRGQCQIPT